MMNSLNNLSGSITIPAGSGCAGPAASHINVFSAAMSSTSEIDKFSMNPRTSSENQGLVRSNRTLCVLVAEDSPILAMSLALKLPQADPRATFSFVGCVEEARKAILGLPYNEVDPLEFTEHAVPGREFDLALLDNQMPLLFKDNIEVNGGKDLARTLRGFENMNQTAIKCFLIGHSGNKLDKDEEADGRILFDGVMDKPNSIAEYAKLFQKALKIVKELENVAGV